MIKLGLMVRDFGPNELSYYITKNVNPYLRNASSVDIIGFFENTHKLAFPVNFALMQLNETWGYDGPLIATTLNTATVMINCPTTDKKIFYIWDLEWLYSNDKEYHKFKKIYCSDNIKLITRSVDAARLVERSWNKQVSSIIPDCNVEKLLEVAYT